MEQIQANTILLLDGGDVRNWCLFESSMVHTPSINSLYILTPSTHVKSTIKTRCQQKGIKVGVAKPSYEKFLKASRRAEAFIFISKDIDKVRRYVDFAFELKKPVGILNGEVCRIYSQF